MRHQKIFSPVGSSLSKHPLLLRNCFNIDVYNEFIRQKKEMRNQFKTEYATREHELIDYLETKMSEGRQVAERIKIALENIKRVPSSHLRRDKVIKLFR